MTLALICCITNSVYSQFINNTADKSIVNVQIYDLPETLEFAGEKVPINYPYVREAIDREVLTSSCMHTTTTLTLRATTRYFPLIESILKKHNIPEDFKYLCMAESALNPNAYSAAKAAGLWQFISAAAKQYGLETGENTDARYNVEQATEAACRYLRNAYERFGSWTLAAASYNAGPAGVANRMKTQGVDDYWDLYLPEETMRYVPRIISLKLIESNPAKYGFHLNPEDYYKPYENYTEITVNHKNIDWSKLAREHGTTYRMLRILNPWIRSYTYANGGSTSYKVKIPTSKFKELGY